MYCQRNVLRIVLVVAVMATLFGLPMAAAGASPENGITSPKSGATASGKVEVTGYASDPSFMKWQLDFLPAGNPDAAIFLGLGTQQGVFTYTLNSALYPAGDNALRLRVVRQDSNYTEYVTKLATGKAEAKAKPAAPAVAATAPVTPTVAASAVVTPTVKPAVAATATVTSTVKPAVAATATVTSTAKPATTTVKATAAVTNTNGLTSPKSGATVSGKVEVAGYAGDPSFMKWQLDLLPGGNADAATFLALGTHQGVFTYTLDSKLYPAGESALRLRVVRQDSNYTEFLTKITIGKP
jgi:hypothetical protein